jgi:hypothetical protein
MKPRKIFTEGLQCRRQTAESGFCFPTAPNTSLKQGVNEDAD